MGLRDITTSLKILLALGWTQICHRKVNVTVHWSSEWSVTGGVYAESNELDIWFDNVRYLDVERSGMVQLVGDCLFNTITSQGTISTKYMRKTNVVGATGRSSQIMPSSYSGSISISVCALVDHPSLTYAKLICSCHCRQAVHHNRWYSVKVSDLWLAALCIQAGCVIVLEYMSAPLYQSRKILQTLKKLYNPAPGSSRWIRGGLGGIFDTNAPNIIMLLEDWTESAHEWSIPIKDGS